MEHKIVKSSEIKVNIELDINNLPVGIKWSAEDGNIINSPAKAFILSMWDHVQKNTMKIDLWTKDMSVEENYLSRKLTFDNESFVISEMDRNIK